MRQLLQTVMVVPLLTAATSARDPVAPTPQEAERAIRFDRRSPVVIAVEQARDAVVNISSTRVVKVRSSIFDDDFERFFNMPDPFQRTVKTTSLGSGVVIHPAGYVLTNAHVVARATEITCSFSRGENGEKTRDVTARLISADPAHDLAILKIDAPDGQPLPHIEMGRSDDLMIGETVIAIGNPLGYSHSVTTGVISQIGREVRISRELTLKNLIQTDASINPGNSGGPLLNINGELIGINTAIRGDAQNIGFAIPIETAKKDLGFLLDFARVNDVVFGAKLTDSRPGLLVLDVEPDTPAAKAKLRAGDRVLAVDGKAVKSLLDFNVRMLEKQAGDRCKLRLRRDESMIGDVTVALAPAPKPDGNALLWAHFGMKVRELDAETARRFRLPPRVGLIVTEMQPDSQADSIGLRVGDVLVQVDRLRVHTLDELGKALKDTVRGRELRMTFLRGRYQLWTRLRAK
jgi:serine protease Do